MKKTLAVAMTAALALGLVATGASAASAGTSKFNFGCTSVGINLTGYAEGSTFSATNNGAVVANKLPIGGSKGNYTTPISVTAPYTVTVDVVAADGVGSTNRTVTSGANCLPAAAPVAKADAVALSAAPTPVASKAPAPVVSQAPAPVPEAEVAAPAPEQRTAPAVTTPVAPAPVPEAKVTEVAVPDLSTYIQAPQAGGVNGSLAFTSNPRAQNANGYEFPGQGFRVYLNKAYTGPGTYEATVQKVGPGFDAAFPKGTKLVGGASVKQTLVVKYAYTTVLWQIVNGDWTQDQPYISRVDGANLAAFDSLLKCDTEYQIDVYRGDASSLWAGGALKYGHDGGFLAYDLPYTPYKTTKGADCTTIDTLVEPVAKDSCGVLEDGVNPIPESVEYTSVVEYNTDRTAATVTFTANEGFKFAEGVKTVYNYTFTDDKCETVPPKTDNPPKDNTPPVVVTPPVVNTPVTPVTEVTTIVVHNETPITPAKVAPVTETPQADGLAYTGSEGLGGAGLAALLLMLAGAGLILVRRKARA